MTRRITWAILLAVWATVVAGSLAAYLTTRSVLVDDLDASLVEQASSLPEVESTFGRRPPAAGQGERFIVRNSFGETLERPPARAPLALARSVVHASFVRLPDRRRVPHDHAEIFARARS